MCDCVRVGGKQMIKKRVVEERWMIIHIGEGTADSQFLILI